jgi:hypothetical protein
MKNGDITGSSLGEIHELIQATHDRDQSMTTIRDTWVATGKQPGPPLARVLQQVEGIVRQLLESVQEAEATAKDAKSRLLPQLNQEASTRKMRSAYAAASPQIKQP